MVFGFQDCVEQVPSAVRPFWVLIDTLLRYGRYNLGKVEKLDV